ncbi:MAG: hypothetical protein ACOYL5_12675 [Phototrophicaceae bacterium]|jgi:hypothetical protein
MAKQKKRGILEEVSDRVREFLDELDRLLQPQPPREPVRIPIPVENPPQRRRR